MNNLLSRVAYRVTQIDRHKTREMIQSTTTVFFSVLILVSGEVSENYDVKSLRSGECNQNSSWVSSALCYVTSKLKMPPTGS